MFTPFDILSTESWILLGTVVLVIRYYIHRRWQVLKELGIPHEPPNIRELGNLSPVLRNPQEFFKMELKQKMKYGKIYGYYSWLVPRITIWDPEVLKQIQINEFSTFPDRQGAFTKICGKVMNAGLNVASGEQWKRIRTTLSPTFSASKLKEMFCIFDRFTDHMLESMKQTTVENDGKFDTTEIFGKLSLDALCSAAFGVNVYSQELGEESKVLKMFPKLFTTAGSAGPVFMLLRLCPPLEAIAEFFSYSYYPADVINYFFSLIDAMVRRKRSKGESAKVDLLQCMMDTEIDEKDAKHATKGISSNERAANSILMIMAGYERTSTAMMFLAYNLAVYKECQEKLRQEIRDTNEEYGGLTYEAINSMKYLTMCINESLRIYPPAVRNSRFCEKDITINGIRIPKGAHIDIPMYGLTRDPEYWDDPLEFKPERMEDMSKIDQTVFQPFGAGPRTCIGMRFALVEIKTAICKIVQNYQLDVADDTPAAPVDVIYGGCLMPKSQVLNLRAIPLS